MFFHGRLVKRYDEFIAKLDYKNCNFLQKMTVTLEP